MNWKQPHRTAEQKRRAQPAIARKLSRAVLAPRIPPRISCYECGKEPRQFDLVRVGGRNVFVCKGGCDA